MAGLTSAIPAACDALIARLNTVAAGYTDPLSLGVIDGDIGADTPPCYVQLGGVSDWVQDDAGLGNFRRNESFVLDCVIQWFDGGVGTDVASAVRVAAAGVLEAVVVAIVDEPTLGGAVQFARIVGGPDPDQGTTASGGWAVMLPFHVLCTVQLQR